MGDQRGRVLLSSSGWCYHDPISSVSRWTRCGIRATEGMSQTRAEAAALPPCQRCFGVKFEDVRDD